MTPKFVLLPTALALTALFIGGCATGPKPIDTPPPAPREFRAAWVATVANIDWPSRPGLSAAEQQTEIVAIVERARELQLNAIILQVRPAADALYASTLEPWSEYLSGTQGVDPGYDPLTVWIEETHRRGLELHAWFNPYRARHHEAKSPLVASHLANTHATAVKRYGEMLWMDPGEAIAVERTLDVIRDVVRRYDVDGVHIDDYFYPYPIPDPDAAPPPVGATPAVRSNLEFPDHPAWQRYQKSGGQLSRADWRRQNVNQLVERMHRSIHELKPWVRFGISPFGIGRPDLRPAGIEGFSQYDQLYADVELWLERGWLDYLTPQLYWPIQQRAQAFAVLLDYWAKQNTAQRHLWPGLFASAINDTAKSWTPEEISQQIELLRAHPAAGGHALFSMAALLQNRRGLSDRLQAQIYRQPALVPATPWLATGTPLAPALEITGPTHVLVRPAAGTQAVLFAIWRRRGSAWEFSVQPAHDPHIDLAGDATAGPVETLVVSVVDRLGQESPLVTLPIHTPVRR
ncbi:MAG: family 10 glycosylhydrolase [Candidatus Didemnitutus sp.]|nr:family 10 glycosylhydrolase [Candidatus Didemnitutus sp.]